MDQPPAARLLHRLQRALAPLTRLGRLPVLLLGASVLLALVFNGLYLAWQARLPWITLVELALLALLGIGFAVWIEERLRLSLADFQVVQARLADSERLIQTAYQRLEAIFRINQQFVEASDERDVVELVLRLAVDLVGARGASYVPLDDNGQPLAASTHGDLPLPRLNDYLEYLATPAIRERCRTCENHTSLTTQCPLLTGPFSGAFGMFCLPVRRGGREFGVLNLFLPQVERMDDQLTAFLQAMMDAMALALEGVRLRARELAALRQLQALREKNDLTALVSGMLDNTRHTLEADFTVLHALRLGAWKTRVWQYCGKYPETARPFISAMLQGVLDSGRPVSLGNVEGDLGAGSSAGLGVRSLIIAPLLNSQGTAVGALLAGKRQPQGFNQRQLSLLQTLAGQLVLGVENANQLAELEYQATMNERKRLAREIHDGLAQTLGFLKLQTAQAQSYLARGDQERLQASLELSYATLSEAYQDVRQAIDGLRSGPGDGGLRGWLEQMASEFTEMSGLPVYLGQVNAAVEMPPEVHAQLMRIVQEALSNVRKHAQASQVNIDCLEQDGDLWLAVRDDGCGFAPEDVARPSKHGLLGMRERAELIGADFQVVSQPGKGAAIHIRLPLNSLRLGENLL